MRVKQKVSLDERRRKDGTARCGVSLLSEVRCSVVRGGSATGPWRLGKVTCYQMAAEKGRRGSQKRQPFGKPKLLNSLISRFLIV